MKAFVSEALDEKLQAHGARRKPWLKNFRTRSRPAPKRPGALRPRRTIPSGHEYGRIAIVKTTIEIPDALLRRAKSAAAERGISLKAFVSEALDEKLQAHGARRKPWMKSFGKLRHLRRETARINRIIEEEFERVEPEDWE